MESPWKGRRPSIVRTGTLPTRTGGGEGGKEAVFDYPILTGHSSQDLVRFGAPSTASRRIKVMVVT